MGAQTPPKMGPGRRAVFKADHESFGRFILSDDVRDAVAAVAEDIVTLVAAASPRGRNVKGDGHMADRWAVKKQAGVITVGKRHPNVRVKVEIFNPDQAAAFVEFGTRTNQRRGTLRRVAGTFGDWTAWDGLPIKDKS